MAGKVVWVSGASGGLGRAAAVALKNAGWQVVSGARSFGLEDSENEAGLCLPLDVRDEASVQAFCGKALAAHGTPDALVCAAGILVMGPAEETSLAEFREVMDTNFYGAVRMSQSVLPLMRENGGGKIAFLSSVNGLLPTPFQSAYTASKHALEGYAECLMMEAGPHNIQVMLVEPGDHSGGALKYRATSGKVTRAYEKSLERVRGVILRDEEKGGRPEDFGRRLAAALSGKRLPARLKVTKIQETAAIVLHDILPGRLFARFLAGYYKV